MLEVANLDENGRNFSFAQLDDPPALFLTNDFFLSGTQRSRIAQLFKDLSDRCYHIHF